MIPNTLSFLRPAAFAAAFLATVSVQADTTVSNLGETGFSSANFSSASWMAVSFTTDGMGYSLNSVSLDLDAVMDTVTVTPGIYADAAGAPSGAPLETLASQTFSSAGIRSFTSAGLSLAPSTTYWVVAKGGGPGIPVWFSTISADQTGSWTIGDAGLRTADGGSTWTSAEIGRFSIEATPVPEPGTVGLIALGGALLVGRRLRGKSC